MYTWPKLMSRKNTAFSARLITLAWLRGGEGDQGDAGRIFLVGGNVKPFEVQGDFMLGSPRYCARHHRSSPYDCSDGIRAARISLMGEDLREVESHRFQFGVDASQIHRGISEHLGAAASHHSMSLKHTSGRGRKCLRPLAG